MTNFETKDSGERAEFSNGGVRDTQAGKPRFDLLLPKNVPYLDQLLTRVALLMGRGAEKYNDRNWEQFADVEALERAHSSALRHLMQFIAGEEDEDHAAAVVFNVMVAIYVQGVLDGKWEPLKGKVVGLTSWQLAHRSRPSRPSDKHWLDATDWQQCPGCRRERTKEQLRAEQEWMF